MKLANLLFLLGCGLIAYGLFLIYSPAAPVFAGLVLIVAAFAGAKESRGPR